MFVELLQKHIERPLNAEECHLATGIDRVLNRTGVEGVGSTFVAVDQYIFEFESDALAKEALLGIGLVELVLRFKPLGPAESRIVLITDSTTWLTHLVSPKALS